MPGPGSSQDRNLPDRGRRRKSDMLGPVKARAGFLAGPIPLRRRRRREREKRTAPQTGGEELVLESKSPRSWVFALAP